MGDLISRQAAIDALIKADYEFTGILSEPRARMFEQTINALPSAQPEIIECKDCKHRGERPIAPIADGRYWCGRHDTFMYYCSYAERRTDV